MVSDRTLTSVTWAVGAVTTTCALAGVALALVEPEGPGLATGAGGVGLAVFEAIAYTALAVLGVAVTSRQPRNPVGWLLQLTPLAMAVTTVSNHLYFHALLTTGRVDGTAALATWLATWMWIFAIVPAFTIFPLLFPTGRPLSRRWLALVWVSVLAGAVTWFGTAFVPGPLPDYPAVVNPFGIDSSSVETIGGVGFAVLVPTAFAAIASVIGRFRRSTGVERQQLKWVATAAALLAVAPAGGGFASDDGEVGFILLSGLLVVAGAVAVAMLRYRLYDIDVVINRTLVYGALSVTLADAAQTLAAFSGRLRERLDLQALSTGLRDVVRETVRPAQVSLWLREG